MTSLASLFYWLASPGLPTFCLTQNLEVADSYHPPSIPTMMKILEIKRESGNPVAKTGTERLLKHEMASAPALEVPSWPLPIGARFAPLPIGVSFSLPPHPS